MLAPNWKVPKRKGNKLNKKTIEIKTEWFNKYHQPRFEVEEEYLLPTPWNWKEKVIYLSPIKCKQEYNLVLIIGNEKHPIRRSCTSPVKYIDSDDIKYYFAEEVEIEIEVFFDNSNQELDPERALLVFKVILPETGWHGETWCIPSHTILNHRKKVNDMEDIII